MQFFDDQETLGARVAEFLHQGCLEGSNALIVVRPSSVQAIGRALSARHVSLQSLIETGRVTVVDAAATLQSLMNGTTPDPQRFSAVVSTLLRQLIAASPGVPIVYGEMVEILATEGNFEGAAALEDLWNGLFAATPFTLLCGYLAPHFTGPRGREALRSICSRHSHIHSHQSDPLAGWLLKQAAVAHA